MAGGSVDKRAAARQDAIEWVQRMCAAVRQAVDADRVIAWLYDAPRQAASPLAVDSPSGVDEVPPEWSTVPLSRMPAAVAVLLESQPVTIEDAQDDDRIPAELAADLGMSSVRLEPLVAGGTVGMISIEPAPRDAAAELHSLLTMVAAAVARAGGRLESDRHRDEAEFLLELTEAATRAPSLEEMLIVICERTARDLGARRATVLLEEHGKLVPRASRYDDGSRDIAEWDAMRQASNPLPAAQVALDSGDPVVAGRVDSPLIGDWGATTFEVQSVLAVPLGAPPGATGVLVLDDPRPDRFSSDDVRLAATAATHVAPTIEQARASDERGWHLQAATAIRQLLEEGARASSVAEAGEVLARVTREAIDAETVTLLVRDEEDRIEHVLTVGADGTFEEVLREYAGKVPARDFRAWRIAARQPKPVFVENARASRLLPADLVERLGLKSYVVVPLMSAARPLGLVICSHVRAPRPWSNEERRLVEQLALEGSLVVENAALRATEQERLEELAHQAFHDHLTELPNRALFADRLQHALERTTRRQAAVAVLFLDLDEFKPINDTFGHEAGDKLLMAVAQRIKACVRPEDTVARLAGDEFTVLLEDIADVRYAIAVAERIEESLDDPFLVEGREARVTASIGIAVSSGRESTPEALLRDSDQAMYQAKRKGRARHEVFSGTRSEPAPPAEQPRPAEEPPAEEPEAEEPEAEEPPVEAPLAEAPEAEEPEAEPEAEEPEAEPALEEAEEAVGEPAPEEELAVEEMAAEASLDDAIVVAPAERPVEDEEQAHPEADGAPEAVEESPQPDEYADEGTAALTEARRRRRLRFPPRR